MKLNKNTKKAQGLIYNHEHAKHYTLSQCYDRPSSAKQYIYEHWKEICYDHNGTDFRIPSHNTFCFTVSFRVMKNNREHLIYVTPTNEYDIEL